MSAVDMALLCVEEYNKKEEDDTPGSDDDIKRFLPLFTLYLI